MALTGCVPVSRLRVSESDLARATDRPSFHERCNSGERSTAEGTGYRQLHRTEFDGQRVDLHTSH